MRMFLISILFLVGCDPSWMDNGLMECDGVELHQEQFPIVVNYEGNITNPVLLELGTIAVNHMIDREIYIMDLDEIPEVVVSEGFIAGDEEDSTYDLTTVDYELDTGNIVQCDVVLNSVFAYDGATMLQTLIHSLGHCLGLDDDPGPPATVDLQSAMSKPLDPLGEFTQHDIEIIQEMFDSASM